MQLEAGHAANQLPGSIWDKLKSKDAQLGILSMVLLVRQRFGLPAHPLMPSLTCVTIIVFLADLSRHGAVADPAILSHDGRNPLLG